MVVICLKISIFVVSNTTKCKCYHSENSCDLLENFYLCGIKHNRPWNWRRSCVLWFAWKFLSLWYQTQLFFFVCIGRFRCDLLENFYLCGIKHNFKSFTLERIPVVICLKISIFVVSNTTPMSVVGSMNLLWFAWKFLSLWYQTQLDRQGVDKCNSCDLLENFYLCGIKHNLISVICLIIAIYRDA